MMRVQLTGGALDGHWVEYQGTYSSVQAPALSVVDWDMEGDGAVDFGDPADSPRTMLYVPHLIEWTEDGRRHRNWYWVPEDWEAGQLLRLLRHRNPPVGQ